MALNATMIRYAKPKDKAYRMYDGSLLYLEVRPTGKKYWRVSYRDANGGDRTKTLGTFPEVGLIAARGEADKIRIANKRPRGGAKSSTMKEVATSWFELQQGRWDEGYAQRLWSRLERDVIPALGNKEVAKIKPLEILEVLQAVEKRGAFDISKRLRRNLEAIFRYAILTNKMTYNPAVGLNDALTPSPKVQHMAAIDFNDLPEFFLRFHKSRCAEKTKLALLVTMMTATRTNEIHSAEWRDVRGDLWTIPAHKMKQSKDHVIPLPRQVQEIFDRLRGMTEGNLIFDTLNTNTMLHALYKMGYKGRLTVHGFRSIFSTHANDSGLWSPDAIERALAHAPDNKVRSAYNRSLYLDERKRMLQWWADKLDEQQELAELLG